MTTEELEAFTKYLEKTILERYENSLERFGRAKALYMESENRAGDLARRVLQLTTSNKRLTNQLTKAKERLSEYSDTIDRLLDIISAARDISPAVSARIDEIKDEVNRAYDKTNE